MKDILIDTINDLVSDLLYYDRKEDEELPIGVIEKAVKDGDITVEQITETFKSKLVKTLERLNN